MFIDKNYYKKSTDYQQLFELLCKGQSVICLADDYSCGKPTGEKVICTANRWDEFDINISSPGCGYLSATTYDKNKYSPKRELEIFAIKCKKMNIEFIVSDQNLNYFLDDITETIKFAVYLTGHDESTIRQMYADYKRGTYKTT